MNQRKGCFILLTVCMLLGSAGCGVRSDKQAKDISKVTTGAAVQIDEGEISAAVKHQLEVLVQNASEWRIPGDENDPMYQDVSYMVTDLDYNGRIEILVDEERDNEEDEREYVPHKCYEVNASGDGMAAIDTTLSGEDFLLNLKFQAETAYCDPKTGYYHYVMQENCGVEDDGYQNVTALTLKDGSIIKGTIGSLATAKITKNYMDQSTYYRVDGGKKAGDQQEEYSIEELGDTVYSQYGKLSVRFSPFRFSHKLEEMTGEQMYHALEKSYQEFCVSQGYPLEKQTVSVYGHEVVIPQYAAMQDLGKQKRINQMIYDWVNQGFHDDGILQDWELEYFNITIKYAGRDRVSLLLEARTYGSGAAYANEYCDTMTLDLEQERIVTGEEILPKEEQEWVEEDILDGNCQDFHGGEYYRKEIKEKEENLFPTQAAQGWQDAKVYQTNDNVGVVVPIKEQGLDAYVYYEVYSSWLHLWENDGIAYADVDWDAYRYQLLAPEYQRLQDYMTVLTGETAFTWEWTEWTKKEQEITKRKKVSISQFFKQQGKEFDEKTYQTMEDYIVSDISFSDLTQDGKMELVLHFRTWGGFYLILHQEGKQFYGTCCGEREFQGLQTDGVYLGSGGAYTTYYYQMQFKEDTFVEELIGERDGKDYYIQGKKVSKKEFIKWDKSVRKEPVCQYAPEALQEKRNG